MSLQIGRLIALVCLVILCGCVRPPAASNAQERQRADRATPAAVEPASATETARYDASRAETLYQEALRVAATGDRAKSVEAVQAALDAGASPSKALVEPALQALRCERGFRESIGRHTRESSISMVAASEPGKPMVVSGVIRQRDGTPVAGALVYVFHTDAKGYYSPGGMDERNPRLFGFIRSDEQGRYEYRTVRPGTYHNEPDIDQHVHYEVRAKGYRVAHARIGFSDDPVWNARSSAPSFVRPVSIDGDGTQRCTLDVVVDKEL